MKPALIFLALAATTGPTFGQSFTCRSGQDAACLDWGDTVCSSSGMCVDANAACFDAYQCDYKGFTCKSKVDECVEAHDKAVRNYNTLVQDYETLRVAGAKLSDAFDDLQSDYDALRQEALELQEAQADTQNCLFTASTLEDAHLCAQ